MTDRELVARIARSAGGKAGYKQLVRELGLGGGRERRLLLEQLARLTVRGELVKLDREHWSIPRAASSAWRTRDNLIAGRLDLHRDGYGFVRPNARQASGVTEDIFIPPNEINGAMQGDQVLVEVEPPRPMGAAWAALCACWSGAIPRWSASFIMRAAIATRGNVVVPFDERMTQPILIPPGQELPAAAKATTPHRVWARKQTHVQRNPRGPGRPGGGCGDHQLAHATRPPVGRVIEVLGDPDDFGVDVEMMIRKHQLPRMFPEKVLAEARAWRIWMRKKWRRRRIFAGCRS